MLRDDESSYGEWNAVVKTGGFLRMKLLGVDSMEYVFLGDGEPLQFMN